MKRWFIIPVLLLLAAGLQAQSFKPIQFEEYKLDNGLTVILHVDRTAPTAMTYLLYRIGSKDEVVGRTGFAHFFEHLMFEGTKNISRGQIDKLITNVVSGAMSVKDACKTAQENSIAEMKKAGVTV